MHIPSTEPPDPPNPKPTTTHTNGASANPPATAPPETPQLSGAELKKRAKAEKAAKRAAEKAAKPSAPAQQPQQKDGRQKSKESKAPAVQQANGEASRGAGAQQQHHKRTGSVNAASLVQRPALGATKRRPSQGGPVKEVEKKKVESKQREVAVFGHLYGQPRRHSIEGAAKEVHPAVLALGLQMSSYVVCGSNARCVAMLLAFKSVIESYTTPPGTSLARHLTSHHLSPQIDYLRSCRPLSISMGNAIRWLKDLIVKIDPSVPENEAKSDLTSSIDTFIRERITAADVMIAEIASSKIVDGDVVLTYAKSSIVEKTLRQAQKQGKRFRVVVVDSKPLFEGRQLARSLAAAGFTVQYSLITAAAHAVKDATKVFVGAHAMMSNGRLYSRVGTAVVAMLAHERDLPVIVCCESVKFTERVALDSIVNNEVAPSEELLSEGKVLPGGGLGREKDMSKWREKDNLQLLNIMFDVTPAEYIKMVVTEHGCLPPSSVPVVHRIFSETV